MAWKDNALGIVIDRTMDADYAELKKQGISFIVIDAGVAYDPNPAFNDQLSKAKAAGFPVLVQYTPISAIDDYTFEAPAREQIPMLKKLLGTKEINGLIISMERYWVGWDLEQQHNPVRIATGAAINHTASEFMHTMTKQYAPLGVQVMIRTNDNFVQKYSPDLSAWTDKFGFFLADWRYRTRAADGSYTNYVTYLTKPTPVSSVADLRTHLPPDGSKNPLVPGNTPSLKFWEFSGDRFVLPLVKGWQGQQKTVKCVLFNGDEAACYSYLGYKAPTTPVDPEEPGTPGDPSDTGSDQLDRIIELLDGIYSDIHAIAGVFQKIFR